MANKHNIEKSSPCTNQPHSREVEHPAIDSKNTFEVAFHVISSQTIEGYPPDIPIQPTLDPSYTSSPDIPNQDSSSNEKIQGVSSEEPLYVIPKTKVNQLHHHTRAYLKSLGQIPIIHQIPDLDSLKGEPNHTVTVRLSHLTFTMIQFLKFANPS